MIFHTYWRIFLSLGCCVYTFAWWLCRWLLGKEKRLIRQCQWMLILMNRPTLAMDPSVAKAAQLKFARQNDSHVFA